MIKKVLNKKILKIIPVWLILVVAISGTATAATYQVMSNMIFRNGINVTVIPLNINSGSFSPTYYVGSEKVETFTYTVDSGAVTSGDNKGYITIEVTGPFTAANDVDIRATVVYGSYAKQSEDKVAPTISAASPKFITYVLGEADYGEVGTQPFNFGSGGTITITVTPRVTGSNLIIGMWIVK